MELTKCQWYWHPASNKCSNTAVGTWTDPDGEKFELCQECHDTYLSHGPGTWTRYQKVAS